MRRLNSQPRVRGVPPPSGLKRKARLLLAATPFLLALLAPTTLEAQRDSGERRAQPASAAGRCPNINLCCHEVRPGQSIPLSATLSGGTPGVKPTFDWTLSFTSGSVVRKHGANEISIDTNGLKKGETILATLEVGGYGPRCSATCSATVTGAGSRADERLGTLSVSLKGSRGGRPVAVPRALINVYKADGTLASQVEPDGRGKYLGGGWTPGEYRVEVIADRFERQESPVTIAAHSGGSVTLDLKPSETQTNTPTKPSDEQPKPSPSPTATPTDTNTQTQDTANVTTTPSPTPTPSWLSKALLADANEGSNGRWLLLGGFVGLVVAGYLLLLRLLGGAAEAVTHVAEPSLGAAAGATTEGDKVRCTVFAPPTARPGDMLKVQVYAHLKEQAESLAGLAAEFDDKAVKRGSEALKGLIERGKELTFTLKMPGLIVEEEERSLEWEGEPASVRFTVTVPKDATPNIIWGKVDILLESVPVGYVEFKFEVVPAAATAVAVPTVAAEVAAPPQAMQTEVMFQKAFISYSRRDSELVLEKVQMLKAAGIECYLDMMTFESGQDWKQMINHYIDVCDVFFLFWSNASKGSAEVDKEIRYALQRREKSAPRPVIKPIPIEGPPVVTPPEYLSHLHFDDQYRYFIKAKRAERLEASAQQPAAPAAT
jgi:hypothetical protein